MRRNPNRSCLIEGCEREFSCKGYCSIHYGRMKQTGQPNLRKTAPGVPKQWLLDNSSYDGDECLRWPFAKGKEGYGAFNGKFGRSAHREMCAIVNGPPPEGKKLVAAHSCGNGHLGCVNPKHLRWDSFTENSRDVVRHRGGKMKINEDDVREIRKLRNEITQENIGKIFGISRRTVGRILSGKSLSWVSSE